MKHSLTWKRGTPEKIADCRVFSVHKTRASIIRDGKERSHDFFYLNGDNWVNVIPLTAEGNVVLIEQYRAGTDSVTLEIPGGTVDAADPSSKEAGARELFEETGYVSDELIFIGRTHPNPAIQSNVCDTYLAPNARQVEQPIFDGTEEIQLKEAPLDSIPDLIATSAITHALVIVAFYYLNLHRAKQS
jgi:8-oxo-dGTP pyrophosphatase MutT (NUDIX family)